MSEFELNKADREFLRWMDENESWARYCGTRESITAVWAVWVFSYLTDIVEGWQMLTRYGVLVGNPLRTDEEEAEMQKVGAMLKARGEDPGWVPVPREPVTMAALKLRNSKYKEDALHRLTMGLLVEGAYEYTGLRNQVVDIPVQVMREPSEEPEAVTLTMHARRVPLQEMDYAIIERKVYNHPEYNIGPGEEEPPKPQVPESGNETDEFCSPMAFQVYQSTRGE